MGCYSHTEGPACEWPAEMDQANGKGQQMAPKALSHGGKR